MPRILVLHATCGGGHKAAAKAVAKALSVYGVEARVEDALDGVARGARGLYVRMFEFSVRRVPAVYGHFFDLTKNMDRWRPFRALRRVSGIASCRRLRRMIQATRPDAVVCTHFLPLEVAIRERKAGRLDVPIFSVVTDYTTHGFWRQPTADLTFCPPGRAVEELVSGGVPVERIVPCGIPVSPEFGAPFDLVESKRKAGLSLDRPTAVLMAGGAGMGPLPAVLREVGRAVGKRMDLVAVCGSNEELKLETMDAAMRIQSRVRVLGYVDPVVDLLRAADVVVTKPGGLTTSELLALGKPAVFYEAAPGQETANAEYAVRAGAGVYGGRPRRTAAAVVELLNSPERRASMASAASAIGLPDAVSVIAEKILGHVAGRVLDGLAA